MKRKEKTPYEELVCLNDARFSEGRVENERSGHPVIIKTDENVEKCAPKWSQRICQFLATKQVPVLEHAP
jgi:hypothetical protein